MITTTDTTWTAGETGTPEITAAAARLAAEDAHGAPYRAAWHMTYPDAVAIARSRHPSRVLANTLGYRYGQFAEQSGGHVTVTMMGSHIATFRPEGVQLWTRGWPTPTTTEALSALAAGVWFETRDGVVHVREYASPHPALPFAEGTIYPYESR